MGHITFRCLGCRALIKAHPQLRGQTRPCPGCGQTLFVRPQRLEDEGPALVSADAAGYRGAGAGRYGG
jgi:predicted RNA-binding Zn-ribbon protein involved in translation (DUF1610 family)